MATEAAFNEFFKKLDAAIEQSKPKPKGGLAIIEEPVPEIVFRAGKPFCNVGEGRVVIDKLRVEDRAFARRVLGVYLERESAAGSKKNVKAIKRVLKLLLK